MATSLYDLSVSTYLQILRSVSGILAKTEGYARDHGLALPDIVETTLHPDMQPLRFQVISVWHHSLGAIKGLREGTFSPPPAMPELDYAGLQDLLKQAIVGLEGVSREEVDALAGKSMKFEMTNVEIPFTTENFILSFSLPNFYFHATTTYDILRMAGVPLGKMDFLGSLRMGA
jgi:hypothetical protein